DATHESQAPLLDQIGPGQRRPVVLVGDRCNEPQIGLDHLAREMVKPCYRRIQLCATVPSSFHCGLDPSDARPCQLKILDQYDKDMLALSAFRKGARPFYHFPD